MPGLIGPEEFGRVAEAALEVGGGDHDVEVLFMHDWGGLTRFADSAIHQSTWREDTYLKVRVVKDGRVGAAATNGFTPEGARDVARLAKEMTGVVSADPEYPGMAPAAQIAERAEAFDEATASATPEQRAEAVAALVGKCPDGFTASGAYETQAMEVGLANSTGQRCWAPSTQASVSSVVIGGEGGNGFAEVFAARASDLDAEAVGTRAAGKAAASQNPRALDPGRYTVVLEPSAVSTLVGFLAFIGFNGKFIEEGRSCFTGKAGQRVAAESISIWDDALDPLTLGIPFDFEGIPRRRVDLVKDGVFVQGVYDMRTARQAGRESTGHALPAPNPDGPFPLNLFMAPGDSSVEEMIASVDRGLLITRFHYSNVVHPVESSITGMTRDGTFLIENGEIAGPVRNFRFTQSILEALSRVTAIGSQTELASEFFFSSSRVPALKIESFNFSGASDH